MNFVVLIWNSCRKWSFSWFFRNTIVIKVSSDINSFLAWHTQVQTLFWTKTLKLAHPRIIVVFHDTMRFDQAIVFASSKNTFYVKYYFLSIVLCQYAVLTCMTTRDNLKNRWHQVQTSCDAFFVYLTHSNCQCILEVPVHAMNIKLRYSWQHICKQIFHESHHVFTSSWTTNNKNEETTFAPNVAA